VDIKTVKKSEKRKKLKKEGQIQPSSRMTNQRLEIISYLQSTREHPTAEKIYLEVKKKLPKISLGTIYRNLEVLIERNLVVKLYLGEVSDRYDGNTNEHYHFFCRRCHRVIEEFLPDAYQLKERVEIVDNCRIDRTDIVFKGICKLCGELKLMDNQGAK
jgi:Fe2+ or Zn2+ uptake regulation protein